MSKISEKIPFKTVNQGTLIYLLIKSQPQETLNLQGLKTESSYLENDKKNRNETK